MSTCCNPPVGKIEQLTSETKLDLDFSKLREMLAKQIDDAIVNEPVNEQVNNQHSQAIPRFDTEGREWCHVCSEYLHKGHLHKDRHPDYCVKCHSCHDVQSVCRNPLIVPMQQVTREEFKLMYPSNDNYDEQFAELRQILSNQIRRLQSIEKTFNDVLETYHRDLNGRLRKVEDQIKEINGQKFSEFHHLTPRVEKLEKWVNSHEAYPAPGSASQKQHGCPNCKAQGKIMYFVQTAPNNELYLDCVLCEGKGIVWG